MIQCQESEEDPKQEFPPKTLNLTKFPTGAAVNLTLVTPEKAIKLAANDFFRQQLSTGKYVPFASIKKLYNTQ